MANRYGKIYAKIWSDENFCKLSSQKPSGRYLFLHLLSGPHITSVPGLWILGERELAERLNWSLQGFRKVFREILGLGMAEYDDIHRVLSVPNSIVYNAPTSPNMVVGWAKAFDEIPDCLVKWRQIVRIKTYLEGYGKAFVKPLSNAFVKPVTVTVDIDLNREDLADLYRKGLARNKERSLSSKKSYSPHTGGHVDHSPKPRDPSVGALSSTPATPAAPAAPPGGARRSGTLATQAPPGGPPERVGSLIGPALLDRGQPTGAYHDQLWEVAKAHADAWSQPVPDMVPTGDLAARIVQVLEHPVLGQRWRQMVEGHHKLASKDNSSYGRALRHVFPPQKGHPWKLDLNRALEYSQVMAKRPPPQKRKEVEDSDYIAKREQEGREADAIARAAGAETLSGMERVRAIEKYLAKKKKETSD